MDSDVKRIGLVVVAIVLFAVGAAIYNWTSDPGSGKPSESADAAEMTRHAHRLGNQKESEAARKSLADMVRDPRREVALAAIRNLGVNRSDKARSLLEDVVSDREMDRRVRAAAGSALGKYTDASPATLARVLENEPDKLVRRGAAIGLANRSSPEQSDAIPALFKALRDPDPRVRQWAATGIFRVTRIMFTFDPEKDPATQGQQISKIRDALVQGGYMN
ncbi:MAG: HEAT repeat domain-containing protein [Phycisphaerae bacterium]